MKRSILLALFLFVCAPIATFAQGSDNGYRVPAIDFRIDVSGVTPTNPTDAKYRRMRFDSSGLPYFLNTAGTKTFFTTGGTATLSANRFIVAGIAGVITAKAAATNGQLLIGSTGLVPAVATLTGTTDQVVVTNGAGTITLSTPQSINTTSSPTFTGLTTTAATTPTGGVGAAGGFAISPRLMATGGLPARVSSDGTDATPVATEVYIAEVFVPANVTVTGVAVFNGSVASGNIKVGLANSSGAVVATSASTAMSGTDAYQRVDFTGTYAAKGPATYFVLLFIDNNTARYNTHTVGNFGASKQTAETYSTGFTTITPPTTFTTALAPIASLY